MKSLKKGFTLVELIVVITILVILATIAFMTLGDYPMEARDSKRQTQVSTIFDKMKIISAKWFKTFVEWTDELTTDSASTNLTWATSANGEVDFAALEEEKTKFTDGSDVYKVTAVKYQGSDNSNKFCHLVYVKWEKKDWLTKSDCPAEVQPK